MLSKVETMVSGHHQAPTLATRQLRSPIRRHVSLLEFAYGIFYSSFFSFGAEEVGYPLWLLSKPSNRPYVRGQLCP
jgi:hypothetical protein